MPKDPQFVAICQNEESEQYWWFADKAEGRCAEPDCDCQPRYYVQVMVPPDLELLKALPHSEVLDRVIERMEGR